ncbi:hypothetical protein DEO72_LG3g2126 [Vigna unguiculata]|uniref:Uncharacterized protein n=1 Tax=Vigna unguiculata TaxID=3917 RepID=A0A4D6LGF0_VIGUN|nr:hypothetical protein DEO72_LG3g2126 [Vigna unguiculata]
MGGMYPDMCTVGEDVVQVKTQSSKEDREKRGWTQLGVDGFVYPGLVSVYTSAQDMVGAMDIGPSSSDPNLFGLSGLPDLSWLLGPPDLFGLSSLFGPCPSVSSDLLGLFGLFGRPDPYGLSDRSSLFSQLTCDKGPSSCSSHYENAFDIVNKELARVDAESLFDNVVASHSVLVAQVEKDIIASFEQKLSIERLRHVTEDHLQNIMSDKVEIAHEKERISKLRELAENEEKEIKRV